MVTEPFYISLGYGIQVALSNPTTLSIIRLYNAKERSQFRSFVVFFKSQFSQNDGAFNIYVGKVMRIGMPSN